MQKKTRESLERLQDESVFFITFPKLHKMLVEFVDLHRPGDDISMMAAAYIDVCIEDSEDEEG